MQQTVEILTRKLEVLGAEKQGTFCVDCETYHTAASTIGSQGRYRGRGGRAQPGRGRPFCGPPGGGGRLGGTRGPSGVQGKCWEGPKSPLFCSWKLHGRTCGKGFG